MKNATRYAVKRFAACIGTLKPAASPAPSSSSSSTPTDCDVSRIHVNARWLVRMLAWVRATLDDAEDMNITEESIRDWLRELQEVADAAEDLLDEFPHEALHHGIVGDGGWTAGSITELPRERKMTSEMDRLHDQVRHSRPATPAHETFGFLLLEDKAVDMSHKLEVDALRMKYIVSRFMKIKKPKQALKLDRRKEQMHAESIYPRRMTNSVIEEPYIVGRVEELAKIKQFLQRDRMSSGIAEFPMSSSVSHLRRIYLGNIIRLPSSMSNLVKLRHLILSSSYIIEYPEGIGKLTDLQTVPGFRVSPKHDYAKLGELKDMNNIRGEFAIKGLQNLADVNEAKKACLDKKRNISSLCLGWDYWSNSSYIDDEVLESLKPNVKLGSLQILGFKGPSYPS
ncbi:hypothetical protein Taro_040911 [Colocasia esculenta]|uniref:Rx N-terminal domain-containing protein n=1 Tax=Colocasia esculenta TaxID=4460 RepID=A0A843WRT5_COLES|nr:hypothetical protein [Colocasia esculenta]